MKKKRMDCGPSSGSHLFVFLFSLIISVGNAAFNLTTISFDEGYAPLFGDGNLVRSPNGRSVRLLLDRFTGISYFPLLVYIR